MSAGHALTAASTLILPVDAALVEAAAPEAEVRLDDVVLVRKKEHHVTVFGFTIGKVLKKAIAADAELGAALGEAIAAFDFAIRILPARIHLVREKEGVVLQTVVARADADLAGFFARAHALAAGRPTPHEALLASLAAPPPPHVTLYTSDPAGAQGIGLNTVAELDEALGRWSEVGPGLRARALDGRPVGG